MNCQQSLAGCVLGVLQCADGNHLIQLKFRAGISAWGAVVCRISVLAFGGTPGPVRSVATPPVQLNTEIVGLQLTGVTFTVARAVVKEMKSLLVALRPHDQAQVEGLLDVVLEAIQYLPTGESAISYARQLGEALAVVYGELADLNTVGLEGLDCAGELRL